MYAEFSDYDKQRWIVNSQLPTYQRRLEQAKKFITDALSLNIRWYVGWSGGKDSTALAYLVNSLCPKITIWSEKDDCDFPNEVSYIKSVAEKYGFNHEITYIEGSLWEIIKQNKINICEDIHSKGKLPTNLFFDAISEQQKNYDGVFLGLRSEEAKRRAFNYRKRGAIYKALNGKYVCMPIINWTGTDVFSYLLTNDVPVFEIYAKTKFVKYPENVRKAWCLPSGRSQSGFCVWLKYYYPELFTKLVEVFPEVRCYV